MNVKRWLGLAGSLALAIGTMLVAAPAAHAGTGTPCTPGILFPTKGSCDGLDPSQSYNSKTGMECSAGATTVHEVTVLGGELELRWGPNCQTNWTRFTAVNEDEYALWVTRLSDGHWAGWGMYTVYFIVDDAGNGAFTDQMYSPGPAAACVNDQTRGGGYCWNQPS